VYLLDERKVMKLPNIKDKGSQEWLYIPAIPVTQKWK
jgi:hypothetical protein